MRSDDEDDKDGDESDANKEQIPPRDPRGWTCPKCGEEIEQGFDVCWNCLYNPAAC